MQVQTLPLSGGATHPPQFYRPFVLVALLFVLTTGAGWGVHFLWQMSQGGQTTAVNLLRINAHGHTLIYGFFGLFICGFAMQAFPRLWGHPLAIPRASGFILVSFVAGIILLVVAQLGIARSVARPMVIAGGMMETAAIALVVVQMWLTFRKGRSPFDAVTGALFLGFLFFLLHTPLNAALTYAQVSSESRPDTIHLTSVYQPALRYLQFHGMTLLLVIAAAARLLPSFYDIPRPGNRKLWIVTLVIAISVLAEAALFFAFRVTEERGIAAMLLVPWLGLLVASLVLILPWKIWRPLRDVKGRVDCMGKFVRASFAWLIVSLVMTILLPFWAMFVGIYFSHAWYGATRQAFTVGFATMMIMGFSARVVPNLNGILPTQLPSLASAFWLTNVGLFLHVAGQCATDLWRPAAYILPAAGVLEFSGIVLWAAHLVRCICEGRRNRQLTSAKQPAPPSRRPY